MTFPFSDQPKGNIIIYWFSCSSWLHWCVYWMFITLRNVHQYRNIRFWAQSGSDWPQKGQIWDLERLDLSIFWFCEPKCTAIWSEKVPNLSHFWTIRPILPQIWSPWVTLYTLLIIPFVDVDRNTYYERFLWVFLLIKSTATFNKLCALCRYQLHTSFICLKVFSLLLYLI